MVTGTDSGSWELGPDAAGPPAVPRATEGPDPSIAAKWLIELLERGLDVSWEYAGHLASMLREVISCDEVTRALELARDNRAHWDTMIAEHDEWIGPSIPERADWADYVAQWQAVTRLLEKLQDAQTQQT